MVEYLSPDVQWGVYDVAAAMESPRGTGDACLFVDGHGSSDAEEVFQG